MTYRYKTSAQSREPGYLAKRFKAIRRLQRMKAAQAEREVVTPLRKAVK